MVCKVFECVLCMWYPVSSLSKFNLQKKCYLHDNFQGSTKKKKTRKSRRERKIVQNKTHFDFDGALLFPIYFSHSNNFSKKFCCKLRRYRNRNIHPVLQLRLRLRLHVFIVCLYLIVCCSMFNSIFLFTILIHSRQFNEYTSLVRCTLYTGMCYVLWDAVPIPKYRTEDEVKKLIDFDCLFVWNNMVIDIAQELIDASNSDTNSFSWLLFIAIYFFMVWCYGRWAKLGLYLMFFIFSHCITIILIPFILKLPNYYNRVNRHSNRGDSFSSLEFLLLLLFSFSLLFFAPFFSSS